MLHSLHTLLYSCFNNFLQKFLLVGPVLNFDTSVDLKLKADGLLSRLI